MRYLIISDIHGNLPAFEAVLAAAAGQYDRVWCLGDIVGYGPFPNECIELLQTTDFLSLAGNHDWAVIDKLDFSDFTPNATYSILWTQSRIKPEHVEFLADLPIHSRPAADFTLVHASPRHQVLEYILDRKVAHVNFRHFDTAYCFVGHTHVAAIYAEAGPEQSLCDEFPVERGHHTQPLRARRLIINPGSVGQPRDGDPRAAYGLLDDEMMTFEMKRAEYDIKKTQSLLEEHSFPRKLWWRLETGY